MSNHQEAHEGHNPVPPIAETRRFRFTFINKRRLPEVHEGVIASQIAPGGETYYILSKDGGVAEAVPLKGRRVLIEPQ